MTASATGGPVGVAKKPSYGYHTVCWSEKLSLLTEEQVESTGRTSVAFIADYGQVSVIPSKLIGAKTCEVAKTDASSS